MKLSGTLALLVSAIFYLATVCSALIADDSESVSDANNRHANITEINSLSEGFDKRQNQAALHDVISSIDNVVNYIMTSKPNRERFTVDFTEIMWSNNSHYNYVICVADHDYNFSGLRGVDWGEYAVYKFGNFWEKVRFDVVIGGAGMFVLHGDGGFKNWAYKGNVASRKQIGHNTVVTFNAP